MLRLSAEQATRGARNAAAHLQRAHVSQGDRVAFCVQIPQDPVHSAFEQSLLLQTVWGALRIGAIPVLVSPQLLSAAASAQVTDCDSRMSITTAAALNELVCETSTVGSEDSESFAARPMHYTSGTTGLAKGVWTGFLAPDQIARWWADEQDQWGFDSSDVTLVHGPLSSSAPLRYSLLVLAAGGDVLLPGKFDPHAIASALATEKPTTAFTVPSHWQRLFALDSLPASPYRLVAHAGSACPPKLKRRLHEWAGAKSVWEFYGSTEGQFAACSGLDWESRPGTLGLARQGRRLFTENDVIWCETPDYSRFEYWRDPQKTAGAWRRTPNGGSAFTVGDLGRLDEGGYLYLDGRREDLIITGGMNVYPAHVEAVLSTIEGVEEVAVFGVDDDVWGQRVSAVVVGPASDELITTVAAAHLAGYQRPKSIYRLAEIPRNAMGKIQRLDLPQYLANRPPVTKSGQSGPQGIDLIR